MEKSIKDFEDLEVWRLGKQLALLTYKLTERFPPNEMYGLISQIRSAAISVQGNIAEGFGRYHYLDRVKFLFNARGSLNELKSHLLIAVELNFSDNASLQSVFELIEILSVKLNHLITVTRKSQQSR
jgi:four helix bundle protein